tara:strand:+ start:294 stop:1040 length:747 start_codon:yes stop_codon:yes gene_type:complete
MEIIILLIAAFITSSISAVIGMGGGVILLGIMAIIIPQGFMAVALHGIIQLTSNITRAYVFKKYIDIKIVKQFFIGALLGLFCSSIIILMLVQFFSVSSANEIKVDFLKPLIGIFIIWYLFIKGPKKPKGNQTFFLVGYISGISTVFIGATGPLIAPFFLKKNLIKESIIANKAICQAITHIGKIPLFIYFFNLDYISEVNILLPLMIAVFIGTNIGKKVLNFIPENIFRILFKGALFIISIKLIIFN